MMLAVDYIPAPGNRTHRNRKLSAGMAEIDEHMGREPVVHGSSEQSYLGSILAFAEAVHRPLVQSCSDLMLGPMVASVEAVQLAASRGVQSKPNHYSDCHQNHMPLLG
jgi:hypothetical protein